MRLLICLALLPLKTKAVRPRVELDEEAEAATTKSPPLKQAPETSVAPQAAAAPTHLTPNRSVTRRHPFVVDGETAGDAGGHLQFVVNGNHNAHMQVLPSSSRNVVPQIAESHPVDVTKDKVVSATAYHGNNGSDLKHREALAQLLGIANGRPCSDGGDRSLGRGCNLGCTCGTFQYCYTYKWRGAIHADAFTGINVGVCGFGFSALATTQERIQEISGSAFSVVANHSTIRQLKHSPAMVAGCAACCFIVAAFVWIQCRRMRRCTGDARRLGMKRHDLEPRIFAATGLTATRRQALLDVFCGTEADAVAREEEFEAVKEKAAEIEAAKEAKYMEEINAKLSAGKVRPPADARGARLAFVESACKDHVCSGVTVGPVDLPTDVDDGTSDGSRAMPIVDMEVVNPISNEAKSLETTSFRVKLQEVVEPMARSIVEEAAAADGGTGGSVS